jgi:hypothetical protein
MQCNTSLLRLSVRPTLGLRHVLGSNASASAVLTASVTKASRRAAVSFISRVRRSRLTVFTPGSSGPSVDYLGHFKRGYSAGGRWRVRVRRLLQIENCTRAHRVAAGQEREEENALGVLGRQHVRCSQSVTHSSHGTTSTPMPIAHSSRRLTPPTSPCCWATRVQRVQRLGRSRKQMQRR